MRRVPVKLALASMFALLIAVAPARCDSASFVSNRITVSGTRCGMSSIFTESTIYGRSQERVFGTAVADCFRVARSIGGLNQAKHDTLTIYSYRSATIGSTRIARRAGTCVAIDAITAMMSDSHTSTTASAGRALNTMAESKRVNPNAPAIPRTIPAVAHFSVRPIMSPRTLSG
jgi:hypothetical protein